MQLNIYNQSKAIIFALTYQKFNVEAFRILSRFQNLEYNSGDEYITDSDFRSGNLVVQNIDTSKKVLTLEFKNLKYTNNLKKEVVLNGTLTIPYKILEQEI